MCILKGFSRLVIRLDQFIRIDSLLKRSPLKIIVPRKLVSFSEISAVNLIVSLFKNRLISFLSLPHCEKMSSIKRFQSIFFFLALTYHFCFNNGHKDVCKCNGHFCTYCSSMGLKIIVSNNWFAPQTRRHMKVEFVVCFSPGCPVFLPNPETNTSKF